MHTDSALLRLFLFLLRNNFMELFKRKVMWRWEIETSEHCLDSFPQILVAVATKIQTGKYTMFGAMPVKLIIDVMRLFHFLSHHFRGPIDFDTYNTYLCLTCRHAPIFAYIHSPGPHL
jgi:hypothetical protein